jgi:hypothetical protein
MRPMRTYASNDFYMRPMAVYASNALYMRPIIIYVRAKNYKGYCNLISPRRRWKILVFLWNRRNIYWYKYVGKRSWLVPCKCLMDLLIADQVPSILYTLSMNSRVIGINEIQSVINPLVIKLLLHGVDSTISGPHVRHYGWLWFHAFGDDGQECFGASVFYRKKSDSIGSPKKHSEDPAVVAS